MGADDVRAVAPHVMDPKSLARGTAQKRIVSGYEPSPIAALGRLGTTLPRSFRSREIPTSTSLIIQESVPRLLATPVDPSPASSADEQRRPVTEKVPLIQGFKATIPSSEVAKQRRRRVRGGLADEDVRGTLGLKKLGDRARGLLTGGGDEEDDPQQKGTMSRKNRRRRRGAETRAGGGRELGLEELMRQADEIGMDKENLRVRRVSARISFFLVRSASEHTRRRRKGRPEGVSFEGRPRLYRAPQARDWLSGASYSRPLKDGREMRENPLDASKDAISVDAARSSWNEACPE